MVLTIALIVTGTVVLAGLELWGFWWIGERDERRRKRRAGPRRARPPVRGPPRCVRRGDDAQPAVNLSAVSPGR